MSIRLHSGLVDTADEIGQIVQEKKLPLDLLFNRSGGIGPRLWY